MHSFEVMLENVLRFPQLTTKPIVILNHRVKMSKLTHSHVPLYSVNTGTMPKSYGLEYSVLVTH